MHELVGLPGPTQSALPILATTAMLGRFFASSRDELGWAAALVALAIGSLLVWAGQAGAGRPRWLAIIAASIGAFLATSSTGPRPLGVVDGVLYATVLRHDDERTWLRVDELRDGSDGAALGCTSRVTTRRMPLAVGTRFHVHASLRCRAAFDTPTPAFTWDHAPLGRAELHEEDGRRHERGRATGSRLHVDGDDALLVFVERLRRPFRDALTSTLDGEARDLAIALVLGDESLLSGEVMADARSSGLAHVLAVSGMHVTLIVGTALALLERALRRVPSIATRVATSRIAAMMGVGLAPLYALFTGASASALRAALTATIAYLVIAMERRPAAASIAALSVLVTLLVDRDLAASPGFVLSIAATASLLTPRPVTTGAPPWLRDAARASIATSPLTWLAFGQVSWLSVVANVVVTPVLGALVLPLATAHAWLSVLSPALGRLVSATPYERAAAAFLTANHALAIAGPTLPPPTPAQALVVIVAAVGLLVLPRARQRWMWVTVALLALPSLELALRWREPPRGRLRITHVDVGQGDAALVDLPDGSLALIDAGGVMLGRDPGREALLPLLRARRRDHLDLVVITHPHPDHLRGLFAVAESISIDELWDNGQGSHEDPGSEYAAFLDALRASGTRVRRPRELCGSRERGGVTIDVLAPCPAFDAGLEPNDNSFALVLRHGRRSFFFAGDLEALGESAVAPWLDRVDVLKVGHHGSRTSSHAPFLAALGPSIAVISAGPLNRFGHPHREALARLAAVPLVLRTDRDGGIILESDGESLTWRSAREPVAHRAPDPRHCDACPKW